MGTWALRGFHEWDTYRATASWARFSSCMAPLHVHLTGRTATFTRPIGLLKAGVREDLGPAYRAPSPARSLKARTPPSPSLSHTTRAGSSVGQTNRHLAPMLISGHKPTAGIAQARTKPFLLAHSCPEILRASFTAPQLVSHRGSAGPFLQPSRLGPA